MFLPQPGWWPYLLSLFKRSTPLQPKAVDMFAIPSPWKLATLGAGLVSLVLTALLLAAYFENRDLVKQRTELSNRINDPKTGYVAQLAQATTNVVTLKGTVERQTKALRDQEAAANARLKQTEAQLALALRGKDQLQQALNRFLATKPQGATLEDRVRDIDTRAMSELIE